MTIKYLKQYRSLLREAERLAKRLEELQNRFTHDTVKGSSLRKPYPIQVITVTGASGKSKETFNRLKRALDERMDGVRADIAEIEEFINTVAESDIRQIIDCRFVQGLSWADTTEAIYKHAHKDTARKAIERYFAKK